MDARWSQRFLLVQLRDLISGAHEARVLSGQVGAADSRRQYIGEGDQPQRIR
jgi:hypothetical protein